MNRPRIGITAGDPAGIGPELVAKLLSDKDFIQSYPFKVVAPRFVMDEAFTSILHQLIPSYSLCEVASEPFAIPYGKHDARCGTIAMESVRLAVDLVQTNELDAIVTCPINKHSIQLAGYDFPGHTEFLGHLTGSTEFSMMLASPKMRVIPVTIHIPLSRVAEELTTEKIYLAILNAHRAGAFFGNEKPIIAVTGLNPHGGDEGTLGSEEKEIIIPALRKAKGEGIDVDGPYPADSLFAHASNYDFIVAMYHDQALIPVKMDGFGKTVNVTLNLPVIRTSVDHGTAFDIAGKGKADVGSLKYAVIMAWDMVTNRK